MEQAERPVKRADVKHELIVTEEVNVVTRRFLEVVSGFDVMDISAKQFEEEGKVGIICEAEDRAEKRTVGGGEQESTWTVAPGSATARKRCIRTEPRRSR